MPIDFGPGINYGLLQQPQGTGSRITQVDAETQPENYRANLQSNTQLQGYLQEAQNNTLNAAVQLHGHNQQYSIAQQQQNLENRQFALDVEKWGPEKAKQLQQMRFAEQANPAQQSLLASQAQQGIETTKQAGLTTQKEQQAWDLHNQSMAAFNKVKASGGSVQQASDAAAQVLAQTDPNAYINYATNKQNLDQLIKNNNYDNVAKSADAVFGLARAGVSLKDYKSMYAKGTFKNIPGMPDPSTMSNEADWGNTQALYVPYGASAKAMMTNQYQLQLAKYKADRSLETQATIQEMKNQANPDNIDALQVKAAAKYKELQQDPTNNLLANEYKQMQDDINKKTTAIGFGSSAYAPPVPYPQGVTQPGTNIGAAVQGVKNFFTGGSQPQAQQPPQGIPPMPQGITLDMIQQELAARQQAGQ